VLQATDLVSFTTTVPLLCTQVMRSGWTGALQIQSPPVWGSWMEVAQANRRGVWVLLLTVPRGPYRGRMTTLGTLPWNG
jgi:hypothetical protein